MRFYALVAAVFAAAFLSVILVTRGLPSWLDFGTPPPAADKPMLSEIERERLRLYPEALKPPPKNIKRSMSETEALEYLERHEVQVMRYGRDTQRKSALDKLRQPFDYFCNLYERPKMLSSIGEYYYHRLNTIERRYDWAGVPAARFIMQRYETAEDREIDAALREALKGGYIKVTDFGNYEQRLIRRIADGGKVTGPGC